MPEAQIRKITNQLSALSDSTQLILALEHIDDDTHALLLSSST